jgi:hypothetical protein
MPGTWKWIPTDSDWAVMPADEAAIKAVESMNATVERSMAHILIEVVSKSGKKTMLEMPDCRTGKAWRWKETCRTTAAQMMRRLKSVYAKVDEIAW